MLNNYFNDYMGFISIPNEKLPPKFTILDSKFHGIENSNHHVRFFLVQ